MVIRTSGDFEKKLKKLPLPLKELAKKKLQPFLDHPTHPSLRIKKIQGYHEDPPIMEMSVNRGVWITFQRFPEFLYLRHIGTHEIFRSP